MHALKEQEREGGRSAAVAAKEEFKSRFVSLVDPAGLTDMEKCGAIARRMGDEARRSGYHAGARMSSLLSDIFCGMADISNRPTSDGALSHTYIASGYMMRLLYDTGEVYRNGGDSEPVAELEEVRDKVARLKSEADAYREVLRNAGRPGSGLEGLDTDYPGMTCIEVIRKDEEETRAELRADGHDDVFPPKPRSIDEFFGEHDDPNISSADMIAELRGRGPPRGVQACQDRRRHWPGIGRAYTTTAA